MSTVLILDSFPEKYGQSFKDYLNNYRMEQAADALLRTDKKIVQIAEDVGYHDLDYFTNRFIQIKGCTPARFRKRCNRESKRIKDRGNYRTTYNFPCLLL